MVVPLLCSPVFYVEVLSGTFWPNGKVCYTNHTTEQSAYTKNSYIKNRNRTVFKRKKELYAKTNSLKGICLPS